jgi:phosphatidylserine/phosphatidylglycerophosphate/cardiolipin synthase-like enzyme
MQALFTSVHGGYALRERVLELISEASALARSTTVDLHIMTFAFTDEEVAAALANAAAGHPFLTVRVLADWSQRTPARGQKVDRLANAGLSNLRVRFKSDQPYRWDRARQELQWSYRVSRGLLHHKTLGVLVDGRPWKLISGSFNLTRNAMGSYENLLVVTAEDPGSRSLMSRIELEFEAIWSDGRAALSPKEADLHYQAITDAYRRDPSILPPEVAGLAFGSGEALQILDSECHPSKTDDDRTETCDENPGSGAYIAFSSRRCDQKTGEAGYAEANRIQRFLLHKPLGKEKKVPLTITNLALDTIFRAKPGDTLNVAMYGLSMRVPEYGAMLDAARRGVRLLILLDGSVGRELVARLMLARQLENLPIELRYGCKTMHQKYVIHPNSHSVLTGTANMTTDASARHSEQRILVRGHPELANQFLEDFQTIWARLSH